MDNTGRKNILKQFDFKQQIPQFEYFRGYQDYQFKLPDDKVKFVWHRESGPNIYLILDKNTNFILAKCYNGRIAEFITNKINEEISDNVCN